MLKLHSIGKLLSLWSCVLLTACADTDHEILLQRMESIKGIGNSNPRAAMSELASIESDVMASGSAHIRNKYRLLKIRLSDKADIMPVSADTIDLLVDYFLGNGDDSERAEAYYYQGSVYRDLQDYPRAVTAFCGVLDIDPVLRDDSILRQNACSQLSELYRKQHIYEEALRMAKAGCAMAEKTRTLDPIYLMDVASAAMLQGNDSTATSYCQKALVEIGKDSCNAYLDVLCEILLYFSDRDKQQDAKACYEMLKDIPGAAYAHNFLSSMACYYAHFVSQDAAASCHQEILAGPYNVTLKASSARWLMKYYLNKEDLPNARRYASLYETYADSAFVAHQYEQTSRACGEHLYAVSLNKELAAERTADRYKRNMYLLLTSLLALTLVFSIAYGQKKKHYARMLKEKQQKVSDLARLALSNQICLNHGQVLQKFREAAYGRVQLGEEDWLKLYAAVDSQYPGFAEAVSSMPRTTEAHIRTAYLLKIGMTNPQIASLTEATRQTAWSRVEKIRTSLGDKLSEVAP